MFHVKVSREIAIGLLALKQRFYDPPCLADGIKTKRQEKTGGARAATGRLCLLLTVQMLAANATSPVVWTLDNVASVGGQRPEALGAPQVVDKDTGWPSVRFNGRSDGLVIPDNPLASWQRFTIEVLFMPEPNGPPAQRFVHLADDNARRVLLETRSPDGTSWSLDTFLHGERDECMLRDMTKLHPTGRWTWAALVYDGRTMMHYVNGVKELEAEVSFEPMTTGRTSLGVRLDRQYWFKGFIKEIRFHPTALAPEALQHY
jgi:hypothetical protein